VEEINTRSLFCGLRSGHIRMPVAPARQELVGTYRATPEWGSSVLVLQADHTFKQTVTTKSGVLKEVRGHWTASDLSRLTGDIALTPYLTVTHDNQGGGGRRICKC
jgi:hypothetical protein